MKATGSPVHSTSSTPESTPKHEKRLIKAPTELVKDGISAVPTDNDFMYVEVEKASSVLPTMWLGTQSGRYTTLIVHTFLGFLIGFFITFTKLTVDGLNMVLTTNFPCPIGILPNKKTTLGVKVDGSPLGNSPNC